MPAARWAFGLGLGLAIGLAGACFTAPQPAVHFSCEPDGASDCPEGYTCQSDGCCHLDGTSFEDHEGECQLAGGFPGTGATDPGATGSSDGAQTEETGQTEESGGSTDASGSMGSTGASGSSDDGGTTAASESGELTSSSSGTS